MTYFVNGADTVLTVKVLSDVQQFRWTRRGQVNTLQ